VQDLTREQPPNDNVKTSVHEEDNLVCEMVSAQCEPIQELAQHSQSAVRYPTGSKSKVVSWDEVVKHSTQDDAWLVIHDKVYDVTDWAPSHPGGSIIYKFAGVDASDQFDAFHLPRVEKRLPRFLIGSLRSGDQKAAGDKGSCPSSPSGATLEYRALRERLRKEGYFEPRMSFYLGKACICAILFISSILIVLLAPERFFWLRTVGAGCLLGLGLQQTAFLGHDVAHHGVCSPTNGGGFNWFAWFLTGPCFGISGEMWNEEHSMHHAITLRPQEDPQFNYLPLWLISMKELDVPGTRIDFFTRFLISVQHLTFLPLAVCIGRINFHGLAFAFCLKRSLFGSSAREQLRGLMDVGGIIIYGLWFVSVVLLLEGWQARTLFFVAAYWMAGILHIQLLVSHLFCETFTAEEEREEQFFSFQLKTTRNIDAAWYDHWFHGGLEYQIEHHLFPQLPRHNLEKVQPFVQDICQRHGIPYNSASMSETLMHIMKDFRRLAFAILTVEIG
jgi:delta8-fatty-acid desaturase